MSVMESAIYPKVLRETADKGIADTTENRIEFLRVMLVSWLEDGEQSHEKFVYVLAVQQEIENLYETLARTEEIKRNL